MPTINFLVSILSLAFSCTSMVKTDRVYDTMHFKIYYTVLDDTNIKEIADSLENSYPKVTSHLQSGGLPVVSVHFYQNIADLLKRNKHFGDTYDFTQRHKTGLSDNDKKHKARICTLCFYEN